MEELESMNMKYNIGDAPEGEYIGDTLSWEEIAKALWGFLDDIDTQPDMLKPDDYQAADLCWRRMVNIAENRHKYLRSDGYNLRK